MSSVFTVESRKREQTIIIIIGLSEYSTLQALY